MSNNKIVDALIAYRRLDKDEQKLFWQIVNTNKSQSRPTPPAAKSLALQLKKDKKLVLEQRAVEARPQRATINFGPRPKRTNDNEDDSQD